MIKEKSPSFEERYAINIIFLKYNVAVFAADKIFFFFLTFPSTKAWEQKDLSLAQASCAGLSKGYLLC